MTEFNLPTDLKAAVKRDWGEHYKRCEKWTNAINNFNDAMELNPTAVYHPLIAKITCELNNDDLENALNDTETCLREFPNDLRALHRKMACLYESNRLEDALGCTYNTLVQHPKDTTSKSFVDIINLNLANATGFKANPIVQTLNTTIKANDAASQSVVQPENSKEVNKNESDVVSLVEEIDEDATPFQKYRAEVKKRSRHGIYFNSTIASMIDFWKMLDTHEDVCLSQTPVSSDKLGGVIHSNLDCLKNYETMLWTRQPLYFKKAGISKKQAVKTRALAFKRLQQTTEFSALTHLDKIKVLAKSNFDEMLKFVEETMSQFYSIKTNAILPIKPDLINKIYEFIGNEYLHRLKVIPSNLMNASCEDRLKLLLKLPSEKKIKEVVLPTSKTFGNRKYFQDPEAFDRSAVLLQEKTNYYKKRLQHSKYSIEKCQLYYQLSRLHFVNRKYEESQQYARESIAQANDCENAVWKFLGYLNIIRCDAAKKNYLRVTRNIKILTKCAESLNSLAVVFVRTIKRTNEDIESELGLQRNQSMGRTASDASRLNPSVDMH